MLNRILLFVACWAVLIGASASNFVVADDWPMFRKNVGRTAVCDSDLPDDLKLVWSRQLPAVTPAFHNARLQFDAGYEPVASDGKILVGSSLHDNVTAMDAETGEVVWTFNTDGPVRCAPAIWQQSVCFGSDDGHLYCVDLQSGKLNWKHKAAPSNRLLLGNKRLISVWPIRGGPVVADGNVYFAAGVWPFEGVFVYAMDITKGEVVWRNDRMGYLFGQQPHNTEAIGGLAPQGYLLIDKDQLVVPCSTAYPAKLNRLTGELVDFELPGPGRLPGGWFSQVDIDTARALRRGTIAFDDVVNRQQHEDKLHKSGGGVSGLSRQIQTGKTVRKYDDGYAELKGKVHSMIVAEDRLYVVTIDGRLSCFAEEEVSNTQPKAWPLEPIDLACRDDSSQYADSLVKLAKSNHGTAFVIGIEDGDLVRALVKQTKFHVVAFDSDVGRIGRLRSELQNAGVYGSRATVMHRNLGDAQLPPYLATLITTERSEKITNPPLQSLRPFGGTAAIGAVDSKAIEKSDPGTFRSTMRKFDDRVTQVIHRVGPIPGASEYAGDWATSEDALVRFPLGVLWFDDTLAHFKRSPQPKFVDGVMISRPKDWHAARVKGNNKIDYPLLPVVLSDIYTGRVLDDAEQQPLRDSLPESDPSKHEPSQYRPPRQSNDWKPDQPVIGERFNPLTGEREPRAFPKTYGCDGGVDYGLFYTLRSGTPAYYDKTIESGTVFLSGPRSGCTNSIIPSGGLLNVPYFYEGCTCSYPLPSAMSLVSMPESFEQWSSWGEMKVKPKSIRRIGLNFGAPGDRMDRDGTLWLDYPSVGGPSPAIDVKHFPSETKFLYQHSMWLGSISNKEYDNEPNPKPWIGGSMAEGMQKLVLNGLKPGEYSATLYFDRPQNNDDAQRIQDVKLQGADVVQRQTPTKHAVISFDVQIDDTFTMELDAVKGKTLISGLELVRKQNPKIKIQTGHLGKNGFSRLGDKGSRAYKAYEFCIPKTGAAKNAIKTIDPTIKFNEGSRGRIGCNVETHILCIGEMRENWDVILDLIADLEYVAEIRECFFE